MKTKEKLETIFLALLSVKLMGDVSLNSWWIDIGHLYISFVTGVQRKQRTSRDEAGFIIRRREHKI